MIFHSHLGYVGCLVNNSKRLSERYGIESGREEIKNWRCRDCRDSKMYELPDLSCCPTQLTLIFMISYLFVVKEKI